VTRLRDYPVYEVAMLLLFSYGSYALAETLRLSGIMALFFSGIALAHFNPPNLSVESTTAAHHIFGAFALIAE
jgi:sodium/hydrogen exchanger 8